LFLTVEITATPEMYLVHFGWIACPWLIFQAVATDGFFAAIVREIALLATAQSGVNPSSWSCHVAATAVRSSSQSVRARFWAYIFAAASLDIGALYWR
jgi:hypothetical protein